MATHELKTWPEPFNAVWRGVKPYEVRRNDRDYRVGDTVILREWLLEGHFYTHREIQGRITYLTPGGEWGLPDDLCVFALGDVIRFDPEPPRRDDNNQQDR